MEIRGHPFDAGGIVFDGEAQFAVGGFHAQVQQKGHQPVPRQGVVILRQDAPHTSGVVAARREVGAAEQIIAGLHQAAQLRQNDLRLKIREHPKERDEPRRAGNGQATQHHRQIVRRRKIANQREASLGRNRRQGRLPRDEDHRGADIRRRVEGLPAGIPQPR